MKDDFFDQIDQWSISVWSKNPWLKSLESGSDRAVFNIDQLYDQWLEFILKNHGITTGPFSKFAEQKKIFRLVKHLNPYYFRSDEVRKVIDQTSTLPPKQKESLTAQITGFFRLMGKTSMNPVVLENLETLEEWWELFEEKEEWSGMNWLLKQDFRVPASKGGFFAWNRFHRGALPGISEHPRKWVELCAESEGPSEAWKWDLKASIFAGEWAHAELPGVCGPFPLCEQCRLAQNCKWPSQQNGLNEQDTIETLIQKNRWDALKTEELAEWLLEDEDFQQNMTKLEGEAEFRLKSIDESKLLEWDHLQPGSKTPLRFKVLLELCRRFHEEPMNLGVQFSSSRDIYNHFQTRLGNLKQERFIIVILDNKHRFLSETTVTVGLLNRSLVHPREVFAEAIEQRAAAIICIHNHPSGDSSPSEEDKRITRRLQESGELLGIPLLDHVIISKEDFTSFADEGWL